MATATEELIQLIDRGTNLIALSNKGRIFRGYFKGEQIEWEMLNAPEFDKRLNKITKNAKSRD